MRPANSEEEEGCWKDEQLFALGQRLQLWKTYQQKIAECYREFGKQLYQLAGPLLAIVVSDNGPGIEPDVIGKLFDAYFTTKSVGEGTGLGLSIVARLIKQAHGAIHLHTKVGHGTTFTIYLHGL